MHIPTRTLQKTRSKRKKLLVRMRTCGNQAQAVCFADMKPVVNLEELPGKVVGRRHPPAHGLALQESRRIEDARAWQRAFGSLPIPKGVYRFRTHEEADEWLWQMLTRPRR